MRYAHTAALGRAYRLRRYGARERRANRTSLPRYWPAANTLGLRAYRLRRYGARMHSTV